MPAADEALALVASLGYLEAPDIISLLRVNKEVYIRCHNGTELVLPHLPRRLAQQRNVSQSELLSSGHVHRNSVQSFWVGQPRRGGPSLQGETSSSATTSSFTVGPQLASNAATNNSLFRTESAPVDVVSGASSLSGSSRRSYGGGGRGFSARTNVNGASGTQSKPLSRTRSRQDQSLPGIATIEGVLVGGSTSSSSSSAAPNSNAATSSRSFYQLQLPPGTSTQGQQLPHLHPSTSPSPSIVFPPSRGPSHDRGFLRPEPPSFPNATVVRWMVNGSPDSLTPSSPKLSPGRVKRPLASGGSESKRRKLVDSDRASSISRSSSRIKSGPERSPLSGGHQVEGVSTFSGSASSSSRQNGASASANPSPSSSPQSTSKRQVSSRPVPTRIKALRSSSPPRCTTTALPRTASRGESRRGARMIETLLAKEQCAIIGEEQTHDLQKIAKQMNSNSTGTPSTSVSASTSLGTSAHPPPFSPSLASSSMTSATLNLFPSTNQDPSFVDESLLQLPLSTAAACHPLQLVDLAPLVGGQKSGHSSRSPSRSPSVRVPFRNPRLQAWPSSSSPVTGALSHGLPEPKVEGLDGEGQLACQRQEQQGEQGVANNAQNHVQLVNYSPSNINHVLLSNLQTSNGGASSSTIGLGGGAINMVVGTSNMGPSTSLFRQRRGRRATDEFSIAHSESQMSIVDSEPDAFAADPKAEFLDSEPFLISSTATGGASYNHQDHLVVSDRSAVGEVPFSSPPLGSPSRYTNHNPAMPHIGGGFSGQPGHVLPNGGATNYSSSSSTGQAAPYLRDLSGGPSSAQEFCFRVFPDGNELCSKDDHFSLYIVPRNPSTQARRRNGRPSSRGNGGGGGGSASASAGASPTAITRSSSPSANHANQHVNQLNQRMASPPLSIQQHPSSSSPTSTTSFSLGPTTRAPLQSPRPVRGAPGSDQQRAAASPAGGGANRNDSRGGRTPDQNRVEHQDTGQQLQNSMMLDPEGRHRLYFGVAPGSEPARESNSPRLELGNFDLGARPILDQSGEDFDMQLLPSSPVAAASPIAGQSIPRFGIQSSPNQSPQQNSTKPEQQLQPEDPPPQQPDVHMTFALFTENCRRVYSRRILSGGGMWGDATFGPVPSPFVVGLEVLEFPAQFRVEGHTWIVGNVRKKLQWCGPEDFYSSDTITQDFGDREESFQFRLSMRKTAPALTRGRNMEPHGTEIETKKKRHAEEEEVDDKMDVEDDGPVGAPSNTTTTSKSKPPEDTIATTINKMNVAVNPSSQLRAQPCSTSIDVFLRASKLGQTYPPLQLYANDQLLAVWDAVSFNILAGYAGLRNLPIDLYNLPNDELRLRVEVYNGEAPIAAPLQQMDGSRRNLGGMIPCSVSDVNDGLAGILSSPVSGAAETGLQRSLSAQPWPAPEVMSLI
ncbi:unnamed protein product [Amoebophrya sp. A25]|nr:unnamed protein product [Amoebophrya sp. A25]|eukprot:GSA25T00021280001.1